MGPATGLPALNAPVTVAGLCRILTGFADPTVLSLSCRGEVYAAFPTGENRR